MIELQPDLELTIDAAERLLGAWLGGRVACSRIAPLKGGMVNTVLRLEFDRPPHRAVVKLHGPGGDSFAAEARALEYLRAETACPVPRVYLHDNSARLVPHAFLLVELLPGACLQDLDLEPSERAAIDRELADVLAELHGHTSRRWGPVGVDADPARRATSWADVVVGRLAEVRAAPALSDRLASEVLVRVDAAIERARPMLHDAGTPRLVHGDVWDGNVIVHREGERWRLTGLLDPDLQFADVELELAYLEVFDNVREAFFASYTRHRPLRPGYERRRLVYWLHTALLHVALFEDAFFREFTARTADAICGLERP